MVGWTESGDIGFDVLKRVHDSLSVSMIMTVRDCMMTCRREDNVGEVMGRNKNNFSFLPVVDEAGCIQGLYKAEQWFNKEAPHQPIGDDFELFSEDLVIGADASILEFVMTADKRPTRLVVSGHQVAGLISLSDLQQLPVRAVLFTLLTSLEIAMATRIETEWPDASGWLELLSEQRRDNILKAIDTANQNDGFVSEILFTQFSDKATIIRKKGLISGSGTTLRRNFEAIRKLRDKIAHANYYAETPEAARKVAKVVRLISQIKKDLLREIKNKEASISI